MAIRSKFRYTLWRRGHILMWVFRITMLWHLEYNGEFFVRCWTLPTCTFPPAAALCCCIQSVRKTMVPHHLILEEVGFLSANSQTWVSNFTLVITKTILIIFHCMRQIFSQSSPFLVKKNTFLKIWALRFWRFDIPHSRRIGSILLIMISRWPAVQEVSYDDGSGGVTFFTIPPPRVLL